MGIESNTTVVHLIKSLIQESFEELWEFLRDTPDQRQLLLTLILEPNESKNFATYIARLKALNNNPEKTPEHAYVDRLIHDAEVLHNFVLGNEDFITSLNLAKLYSENLPSAEVAKFALSYIHTLHKEAREEPNPSLQTENKSEPPRMNRK